LSSAGNNFKLSDYAGKTIVLYFYPKDDTPGCTLEGQEFSLLKNEFTKKNCVVFGISKDNHLSHCKFVNKYGLKIELLSDEDEKVCKMFDVIKEKNNYGKKYFGIERSTFIVDPQQNLRAEFRKVSAAGHAKQILDLI
jgi:peroxiredoxin Q/BCP